MVSTGPDCYPRLPCAQAAPGTLEATSAAEPRHLRRAAVLQRLLPGLMFAAHDDAAVGSVRIIAALRAALRRERARAGHQTYDINRHIGLAKALRAELGTQKNVLVQARTNTRKPSGLS